MTAEPGTGRGAITDDGCAVELYRQFPPMGEAELLAHVHDLHRAGLLFEHWCVADRTSFAATLASS